MAYEKSPLPETWKAIRGPHGAPYMKGDVANYRTPSDPAELIAWIQFLVSSGVTFIEAEVEHDYDGPTVTWRLERPATSEEAAEQEARVQRDLEAATQRERAEFERLKAKFGGAK